MPPFPQAGSVGRIDPRKKLSSLMPPTHRYPATFVTHETGRPFFVYVWAGGFDGRPVLQADDCGCGHGAQRGYLGAGCSGSRVWFRPRSEAPRLPGALCIAEIPAAGRAHTLDLLKLAVQIAPDMASIA